MTYSTVIRGLVGVAVLLVAAGCGSDDYYYGYEPVAYSTQAVYATDSTALIVDDGDANDAYFVDTVHYPVVHTGYHPRVVVTNAPLCRYGCVDTCHHGHSRARRYHSDCVYGCAPNACRHRNTHAVRRTNVRRHGDDGDDCRNTSRTVARRQPQRRPNVHDGDRLISRRQQLEAQRKATLQQQRQLEAQQQRLAAQRAELKRQQAAQRQAQGRNQRKTVAQRTPSRTRTPARTTQRSTQPTRKQPTRRTTPRRTTPRRTQLADNTQRGR